MNRFLEPSVADGNACQVPKAVLWIPAAAAVLLFSGQYCVTCGRVVNASLTSLLSGRIRLCLFYLCELIYLLLCAYVMYACKDYVRMFVRM